jgi:inorganic phosphate transporter, PiT family
MLDLSFVLVILVFLSVMLVAGNNISACVGPTVGSRIVARRVAILLGALGFSTGLLVQGLGMTRSVGVLLPNASSTLRTEALLVAIIVFLIAFAIRVPMSMSMSLVGLLSGLSVAEQSITNLQYLVEVVVTWVLVPVVSFAFAFYLIRFLNRSRPTDFWRRLQDYKIVLIVLSFFSAYVTGANTLGLIVATGGFDILTVIVALAAIFVGSFFLSEGAIRRVSEEFFLMRYANAAATLVTSTFLVEAATVFNIPLSVTQTTSTAVFGTGMSYKTKFITTKPFLKGAAGWVVAPLLSFAVGLLIA